MFASGSSAGAALVLESPPDERFILWTCETLPVSVTPVTGVVMRFADYEADSREQTVRRNKSLVAIQDKPLQLLLALLEHPGQLVSREELRNRLWPTDAFGAFEDGLNTAVRKLRIALNDSAEMPQFIETVPRRGYRFIAPVDTVSVEPAPVSTSPAASLVPIPAQSDSTTEAAPARMWSKTLVAFAMLAVIAGVLWLAKRWLTPGLPPAPRIASLAVLPMTNLTGDAAQDYFADAMTEELTSDLGKISALRVISRTSAMHYKNTQKTTPEIARELNVDGVIEGSVVRSGDRVRITAQLIDARLDRHLWSESYERDLKDVLTLQGDVARAVAGQVRATITPGENKLLRPQSVNPQAYEAYMRGRFFVDRWTPEDSGQALRSFEQAAALDNNYALAYVGMAECYVSGVAGVSDKEGAKLGIAAVNRALELKPDMGEAHAMLGMLRLKRDWDFAVAEAEIKKGISLSPNYPAAHHWYSHLLIELGRFDESLVQSKLLLELDPVSPTPIGHLAHHYRAARQWDLAIAQYEKELAMDPTHTDEYGEMGEAYVGKRMFPEAIRELSRAVEMSRTGTQYPYYLARLGYARAQAGDIVESRKILTELPSADLNDLACLYAGLGYRDKSIDLLNESFRRHTFPLDAGYAVEFDPLRSDPRFIELLHRVGLR
jgi:TolB-like protein/DNA-binding winged helix-turn-helix (wHTH) protein/tetratricopeptide (TPR) repeat protein